MSGTAFSNPRPVSVKEPVPTSIHRTSTGDIRKTEAPVASLKARPTSKAITKPTLAARTWRMNFWMLSKMRRPSSMALRMEAKLSSVSTMSAESFATSEPVPMAIPMSARLRLGLSFTPSPVIATYRPRRCSASIIRTLVLGAQRATTTGSRGSASISASVSASKSCAAITIVRATSAGTSARSSGPGMIATSVAIACAVFGWSPVNMCTAIPACLHCSTLSLDSGRGGS